MTQDEINYTQPTDEADKLYCLDRAQWHEHRAGLATEDSTRSLHLRFAALYTARAQS